MTNEMIYVKSEFTGQVYAIEKEDMKFYTGYEIVTREEYEEFCKKFFGK